jgi:hypothetical protein
MTLSSSALTGIRRRALSCLAARAGSPLRVCRLRPKVTLRGVQRSEWLWPARLRWRLRGAWMWPAYFALTLVDGVLIALLPPYDGTPPGIVGALLLAGFANLLLLAVVAPLAGLGLRRLRPDLPRAIARDYAGAGLVAALTAVLVGAGIAHRSAVAAERADRDAVAVAVRAYVDAHAADWRPGLAGLDTLRMNEDLYRACVPGADARRWLCLVVETDRRPPAVQRDDSMEPNSALRTVGGFH